MNDNTARKELENMTVQKRRYKDLDNLKKHDGPFTDGIQVKTYYNRLATIYSPINLIKFV